MNIGAHVRGGGQLVGALDEAVRIGAASLQILTQSPRAWKPTQYAPEVLARFREAALAHDTIQSVVCHATYLINLATDDPALYERSVTCLTANLSVARGVGAGGLILHVGSHKGAGFDSARARIAAGLRTALRQADPAPRGVEDCPILIENAAGTGGTAGRDVDEIASLIDDCDGDERLGLCVDTQHLWASGVDFSTVAAARRVVTQLDRAVGIARLRCLHLNDSKVPFGANRDRHANLNEGTITVAGLAPLVGHPKVRRLPMILEVPGDGGGPRAEDVSLAQELWRQGVALYQKKK